MVQPERINRFRMKDASRILKAVFLYTIPVIQIQHSSMDNTVIVRRWFMSESPRMFNPNPTSRILRMTSITPVQNRNLSLYGAWYASSRGKSFILSRLNTKWLEACMQGANKSSRVNGRMKNTVTATAIRNKAMCFPWKKETFPSYSHTASGLPSSWYFCRYVNEKVVMTVRCSLVYDRRNRVASTETALEPTNLTMVMECLLK